MTHQRPFALIAFFLLSWPCAGTAQETSELPSFSVAPHVGVLIPQPFSDLGSFPIAGVEIGYVLPFDADNFIRPAALSFDVMATSPGAEGNAFDSNLGEEGASYDWSLRQNTLILELTAVWRFMPPGSEFVAYGQFGPRLYLIESVLEADSGGQDFGTNRETNNETGLVFAAGVEWGVGPGALFGALEGIFSHLGEEITGSTSNSALSLDVGYRLWF